MTRLLLLALLSGCTLTTVQTDSGDRRSEADGSDDAKEGSMLPQRAVLGGQEGEPVLGGQEGEPLLGGQEGEPDPSAPPAPPGDPNVDTTEETDDDGLFSNDADGTDSSIRLGDADDTDTGDTGL